MWAAHSIWQDKLKEYFNCDQSVHMNHLSDLIVKGKQMNK
jgi:hypothetical protein